MSADSILLPQKSSFYFFSILIFLENSKKATILLSCLLMQKEKIKYSFSAPKKMIPIYYAKIDLLILYRWNLTLSTKYYILHLR